MNTALQRQRGADQGYIDEKHPERFSIWTNAGMSCRTCKEKLCHHKKQLQGFWKKNKELIRRF